MEKKLDSLLHSFEYHAREAVNAVQDRAQALKLSKDAERRIAKLRREFREQFDSTVVAHSTGSDVGDERAQPHIVQSVSVGDTVRLRSLGRDAKVLRQFDDDSFEVAVGPMKMKVPRDDVATVVAIAGANPVTAARARGVVLGRQEGQRPSDKKAKRVLSMHKEGLSYRLIGRNLGLSKNTVMEIVKRDAALSALARTRAHAQCRLGQMHRAETGTAKGRRSPAP